MTKYADVKDDVTDTTDKTQNLRKTDRAWIIKEIKHILFLLLVGIFLAVIVWGLSH